MAEPTAWDQYLLELTNRARLNPQGEYDRLVTNAPANVQAAISYFHVDLNVLKQQFSTLTAVAPLIWNDTLSKTALAHTALMIAQDTQAHVLTGEASLGQRILDAGYKYHYAGENIYAYADDAFYAHAGFFIDWGYSATGIQSDYGHRVNIMSPNYTEVGIGHLSDRLLSTSVGPEVVTQDFGSTFKNTPSLTGVAIKDANGDHFYNIGEGLGGVVVTATGASGTYSTQTWTAGGYTLAVPSGSYTVSFTYQGQTWNTMATVAASNVEVSADFSVPLGTHTSTYEIARFFNIKTGEHFFTANQAERDLLIATGRNWNYEGNAFDSNATPTAGQAVYRFYNGKTDSHFYTVSDAEKASILASLPQFKYEGVAYYAYADAGKDHLALYRFFDDQSGTHFFTTSDAEKQQIVQTLSHYHYEGVAYYVDIA